MINSLSQYGIKILVALILTIFSYPPLSIDHFPVQKIDIHEALHFRAHQAMLNGETYYIHSASNQYGPGSLKLNNLILENFSQVSLQGLKHSNYLFHFFMVLFIVLVILLTMNFVPALFLSLSFLTLSPVVNFFYVENGGIPIGFWGWGNIGRYMGTIILPFLFYKYNLNKNKYLLFTIGILVPLFAWISQENLLSSILLLIFFLILRNSTEIKKGNYFKEARVFFAGVMLSSLLFTYEWSRNGVLFEALQNYFLVPSAVSNGYSNTVWSEPKTIFYWIFQLSPILIVIIFYFLLVFTNNPKLKSQTNNLVKLGLYLNFGYSVSYMGSLFRSDQSHTQNTTINLVPLTFVIIYAIISNYGMKELKVKVLSTLNLILFSTLSMILTVYVFKLVGLYNVDLKSDFLKKSEIALMEFVFDKNVDQDLYYLSRIGFLNQDQLYQICCPELDLTYSELHHASNLIREKIGDKQVYISTKIPYIYPEVIYFVADLNPAKIRYERLGLQINDELEKENMDFLDLWSDNIKFIITNKDDDDIEDLTYRFKKNFDLIEEVQFGNIQLMIYEVN